MANDTKRRLPGSELVSGVLATAALGGAYAVLHLPVMIAAGVALAVYGGTWLLFGSMLPPPEGTDAYTSQRVARGQAQVAQLRALCASIAKPSVRASIAHICHLADQIFAIFVADPAKAPLARGFVDFTLTQTLTIVTRYNDLSSRSLPSAQTTLERTESLLSTIDASFSEQIEKLLREDVADLDSEIEVLQTRLDLEGDEHQ